MTILFRFHFGLSASLVPTERIHFDDGDVIFQSPECGQFVSSVILPIEELADSLVDMVGKYGDYPMEEVDSFVEKIKPVCDSFRKAEEEFEEAFAKAGGNTGTPGELAIAALDQFKEAKLKTYADLRKIFKVEFDRN